MRLPRHLDRIIINYAGYLHDLQLLLAAHRVSARDNLYSWDYEEDIFSDYPQSYDEVVEHYNETLIAITDLHSPFMYKCICMADIRHNRFTESDVDRELLEFARRFQNKVRFPDARIRRLVIGGRVQNPHRNFPGSNLTV